MRKNVKLKFTFFNSLMYEFNLVLGKQFFRHSEKKMNFALKSIP
jgi:hypothetical protein